MLICPNCGVELEESMNACPLCRTVVRDGQAHPFSAEPIKAAPVTNFQKEEKQLLQRVLWQVTSILLFSGIISTLIINLVTDQSITWSIYPVTVCLIIFSYVSLFAFWHTRKNYQLIAGWVLSTALLIGLDIVLRKANWPMQLALPLLGAVNAVAVVLIAVISRTPYRGVNVIAYTSVALAVLCLGIEGIISFYVTGKVALRWSVIVAACLLPVTAGLLFMHFRIKKNPEMEKIFHT